ncbi:protein of unknown function DUF4591, partial [Kipferlia bialata]|eukprot:g11729.t1
MTKQQRRGGLGQDLERESTKAAREQAQKRKAYAEKVRQSQKGSPARPRHPPRPSAVETERRKKAAARKRAMNYSKSVPKPRADPDKAIKQPKQEKRERPAKHSQERLDELIQRHEDDISDVWDVYESCSLVTE